MSKGRLSVLAAVCLGVVVGVGHAAATGGADSIRRKDLRRHVRQLASDEFGGRGTGEEGIARAEEYIAARFAKLGLAPLPGREGHFVDVTFYRRNWDARKTRLEISRAGRSSSAVAGSAFSPFDFTDEGSVRAEVVFAGYGITSDEHSWDDYADLDVDGKLVLVLRHEPRENDPDSRFDGVSSTEHANFTTKASNAREHGALGMLLVTDPLNHPPTDDLRLGGSLRLEPPQDDPAETESGEESDEAEANFLAVHISRETAALLVGGEARLREMQRSLDDETPAAELADLGGVSATLEVTRRGAIEEVAARNVAAFLPGSDPALADEWIVVGAHHDHLGRFDGSGDTVYNGADDNASGTSGLLELAEAFARQPQRPRRSIAFMTFTGEERGLLGSRAVVEQELFPVDNVVFMFNLDMIGRNSERDIEIYGDGYVRGTRQIVEAANRSIGLPLQFAGADYTGASDHDSFYRRDVPFMFLFTGTHADYHQLGDHADKLDYPRMESIVRLAHAVLGELADADHAPGFIHHVNWLGARVEVVDGRAEVTEVDQASRAAEAGFTAGDVLVAFDEEAIEAGSIGERFREIEPGTELVMTVARGEATHDFEVRRARTGYMGVAPGALGEDDRAKYGLGEDEGMRLRRVMDEGPSAQAGLRDGDIVYRIDGRPVGPTNLRRTLSRIGAGETVSLAIIRDGERSSVEVTLGERPDRR